MEGGLEEPPLPNVRTEGFSQQVIKNILKKGN